LCKQRSRAAGYPPRVGVVVVVVLPVERRMG